MKFTSKLVFACFLLLPFAGLAQKTDTLVQKLDSLSKKTDSANGQVNNINRAAYNENTKITPKVFFVLLGSDLKQEITAPFHMDRKDWRRFAEFGVAAVALGFADEPIQRYALKLRTNNKTVSGVSKYVTRFGGSYEVYTLATFGAYGFIFKSEKVKTTTLLAVQAYITGGAMEAVIKFISGRQRPTHFDPTSTEVEPKFRGPFYKGVASNGKRINSSFPSGHTTVAFAAATVFAMEYKDRPLVPFIAYSAATLIGLSRITENKHWATDVFVGAGLGFLTGRQVVNNYHRYAKLKAPQQKKNSVSFDMMYNFDHVEPAIVYTLR